MLRNQNIKHSYRHARNENPISDFLVPALNSSLLYRRAAGYFSSAVFAHLAPGIGSLVSNGGRMKLITSHSFTVGDAEALSTFETGSEFENQLFDSFQQDYEQLVQEIERHHVRAMLWMLQEGLLEIKIVVPKGRVMRGERESIALYHQKFGILSDASNDRVCFAGSLNETVNGWLGNFENMNVYCSWKPEQSVYLDDYEQEFEQLWSGDAGNAWVVVDLPEAVAKRLIESNGVDDPRVGPAGSKKHAASPFLRPYQQQALQAWVDSGRRGLLEMATGTGKTRTAKACIEDTAAQCAGLLTIVVAPYQHIADQWAKELAPAKVFEVSSSSNWRRELEILKSQAVFGYIKDLVVIVVKNTAGSDDFTSLISSMKPSFEKVLVVGDEVHWLGANAFRGALLPFADYRLGLSATPNRYFDEEGSDYLQAYFRPKDADSATVFEFTLSDALNYDDPLTGRKILCPYNYHPVFVELDEQEQQDFDSWSQSIARLLAEEQTPETREKLSEYRIARSMILKKAAAKVPALEKLLSELGPKSISQALVYCAESTQMEKVGFMMSELRLDFGRITSAEGARPSRKLGGVSERERILHSFAEGRLNTLLAIDCLDEGVDIPSAQLGFILASSGNPKEFIQRRGRLLRQFPGKSHAEFYDFVVLPASTNPENASIKSVELRRIDEFSKEAMNRDEVLAIMREVFDYKGEE